VSSSTTFPGSPPSSTGWLPVSRHLDFAPDDRSTRRRIGLIWGLLFFNVLSYASQALVIPIPSVLGKLLTQGALWVAFLLALTVNRKLVVRPNVFLVLSTILAAAALMMSIRDQISVVGSDYRAIRLIVFVSVLWLLTPWWGRKDLFLLRCQLRALVIVLGSVLLGLAISPGAALAFQGRLQGAIWPIPATQVAHYAAITAGLTAVLWFSGLLRRNLTIAMFLGSVGILVLTHTRTALIALLAGILVAGLSLFTGRKRVRNVFATVLVILLLTGVVLLPALTHWFGRGQSTQEISQLTGRTVVWSELVNAPRPIDNMIFGFGLSNDSFDGLSIDNSWLAVYQGQGLVGDVLCGAILLSLLLIAAFRPRGPTRALALFLLVYCLIASFTETGLGGASTYMLDLTIAASLLVPAAPGLYDTKTGLFDPEPDALDAETGPA
jgi:O-Antigen ligase